jgi:hypothetical protein
LFLVGFSNNKFDGEGEATITPQESILLEKGEYTIRFVVGEHGIKLGGGIKTRFPKPFFRLPWKTQTKDKTKNNFLKIGISREESNYKMKVKKRDNSLNGQCEWYSYVITVTITDNPLKKDDVISLTFYKNISAGATAYTDILPVASDVDGDGNFIFIKDFPQFTIRPGSPEKIYNTASTTQQVGKEFNLKVVILDRCNNAAGDYSGTVEFISSDKKARLPEPYTFTKADGGIKKFPVTLNTSGYHTVTVSDKRRDWSAISNPIDCKEIAPKEKIWWGDIHSHTEISMDALGNGSFKYARDVAGLDFYSQTDHSGADRKKGIGIIDEEWDFIKQKVVEFYDPGVFVTILGYECSMPPPSGHHNVYFNALNELIPQIPIIRRTEIKSNLLTLWENLEQKIPDGVDVITIPHHTGPGWKGNKSFVSYDKPHQNPKRRVALEIFSRNGYSEKFYPISAFKGKGNWYPKIETPNELPFKRGPFAQDIWAKKLYLGVIAASDDHHSHPGMTFKKIKEKEGKNILIEKSNPLAAVYAKDLTRDSIFNAIKLRRTYAVTSGERIILNFAINGYPMGSEFVLQENQKPRISLVARGTDLIKLVEILKWDFSKGKFDATGHPIFETILQEEVKSLDAELEFIDNNYDAFSMYYVRLRQSLEQRSYDAWAWTSPIWVMKE